MNNSPHTYQLDQRADNLIEEREIDNPGKLNSKEEHLLRMEARRNKED